MYAVIRRYRTTPGVAEELSRVIEEQFVPRLRTVPGFVAYYALYPAPDEIATFTLFRHQSGVEESVRRAADWVKQNPWVSEHLPNPPELLAGPVTIHVAP